MNAKPSEFFLSVVDFFALLVPGGLLVASLPQSVFARAGLEMSVPPADGLDWALFLFVSYVFGHFLYTLSALTLNPLYDRDYGPRKRRRYQLLIEEAARRAPDYIKSAGYEAERANEPILRWVRAHVRTRNPAAASSLDRQEASAKLFRSLAILFLIMALLAIPDWTIFGALLFLCGMSVLRFENRRSEFDHLTYEYFVVLNEPESSTQ